MRTIIVAAALTTLVIAGAAHAKDMKACSADWNTAKAAHTSVKHKDFMAGCLKGPLAQPTPIAAPVAKRSLFSRPAAPVARPVPTTAAIGSMPANATAQCRDGSWSLSAHHSGSCSHHGGVAKFLK